MVIGNGRIVAQGTKTELLAARPAPSSARRDRGDLAARPRAAGLSRRQHRAGAARLRADADPELVGKVALQAGVPLTELRAADGAGLEEMFLELTADTQREGAAA